MELEENMKKKRLFMNDQYNIYNLVLVKYFTNGHIYHTCDFRTDKSSEFRVYPETNSNRQKLLVDDLNSNSYNIEYVIY